MSGSISTPAQKLKSSVIQADRVAKKLDARNRIPKPLPRGRLSHLLVGGQPRRPKIATSPVPGPKSQDILASLNEIGDFRTAIVAVDYKNSKGNYIVDADGNTHLDCFGQIASISVGYRNTQLDSLAASRRFRMAVMNRPALGVFPPTWWRETLEDGLMKESVRPKGLTQIFTANCGSTANESAYKAVRDVASTMA